MDINNELEQKLINSNNHIDNILDSIVNVKFICKINNQYLMNKETMSLPNITISKGLLNHKIILDLITKELNIPVINIETIPFRYYHDYDKRYYIVSVDINQMFNLNPKYIYSELSNITNKQEYSILLESESNNEFK